MVFSCQVENDDTSRREIEAPNPLEAAIKFCDHIDPPDGAVIAVENSETGDVNSYGVTRRVVYGVSEV